jgi:hypothetical protein
MIVPEAAMEEQGGFVTRKRDVGLSRELRVVQPESITMLVQQGSHQPLRTRVLASNAAHDPAALFRGDEVDHASANAANPDV